MVWCPSRRTCEWGGLERHSRVFGRVTGHAFELHSVCGPFRLLHRKNGVPTVFETTEVFPAESGHPRVSVEMDSEGDVVDGVQHGVREAEVSIVVRLPVHVIDHCERTV